MNKIWQAHFFLFITSLIQGFNFSIAKIVMPEFISPGAIIVVRGVCATLFFWAGSALFLREKIRIKKDFLTLFFCSISGIAINQLLFYKGLSLTKPINASLMVTISPVMVLLISAIMIGEKITRLKVVGILVGAAGVIFLLLSSNAKGPESLFIGDLLILINAASYAVFLVLVKPLMAKYHPLTVLKWTFLFGFFMVLPFGWKGLGKVHWESMPVEAWFSLAFVVIFATLVTYSLNVGVLKTINPSLAGIYIYLQPAMAACIAVAMRKDTLTLSKTLYCLMIFSGVYLVSKKTSNKKKEPNPTGHNENC